MHSHALHVLGVQVLLKMDGLVLLEETLPKVPRCEAGRYTSSAATRECAAMLLPRGAEMFTIYIDKHGGHYVRGVEGEQDCSFFVLKERWCTLRNVLPADSTCRAIVYSLRCGRLVMGVYDVTRLAGVDKTSEPVFSRQEVLFNLWRTAAPASDIEHHWVGMEGSLFEHMREEAFLGSLPFDVDHLLRLTAPSTYQLVMRPLCAQGGAAET
jgi:hypothetical protein